MPYSPSTQAHTGIFSPVSVITAAGHPGRGRRRGVVRRPGLEQGHDLGAAVAGARDQLVDLGSVQDVGERLCRRRNRPTARAPSCRRASRASASAPTRPDAQRGGHVVVNRRCRARRPARTPAPSGTAMRAGSARSSRPAGWTPRMITAFGDCLATFSATPRTILALTSSRSIAAHAGLAGRPAVITGRRRNPAVGS